MPYDFYKSLLTVSSSPSQEYIDDLQALINQQFDNASSLYTVKEETSFGSGSWQDVTVRLSSVVQSKTGTKYPDDYKQILFKNLSHVHDVGYKYLIDNISWLSVIDKSVIRKCNNTLKWIYNTSLYVEPCIVDDVFSSVRADSDQEIDLQKGQILVKTQFNSRTANIKINHRFILNGEAYKVIDSSSLGNSRVYNLVLEFTETREDDDLINNIADTSKAAEPEPPSGGWWW